jgi:hypothetical protein
LEKNLPLTVVAEESPLLRSFGLGDLRNLHDCKCGNWLGNMLFYVVLGSKIPLF